MTTLQELWYGNIRPNEDKVITDEEKELVSLIVKHHEKCIFFSLGHNEPSVRFSEGEPLGCYHHHSSLRRG